MNILTAVMVNLATITIHITFPLVVPPPKLLDLMVMPRDFICWALRDAEVRNAIQITICICAVYFILYVLRVCFLLLILVPRKG